MHGHRRSPRSKRPHEQRTKKGAANRLLLAARGGHAKAESDGDEQAVMPLPTESRAGRTSSRTHQQQNAAANNICGRSAAAKVIPAAEAQQKKPQAGKGEE